MRKAVALIVVLLVAACSGGGDDTTGTTAGPGSESSTTTPSGDDSPSGNGDVDCAAIAAASAELIVPVQLLAQVRDPESVELIKSGSVGTIDIDAFLQALDVMHALDGFDNPLGDPKASLDFYEEVGTQAKALFEADTVTQADIDAYNETVGEVGDYLNKQTAIAGALDAAGC